MMRNPIAEQRVSSTAAIKSTMLYGVENWPMETKYLQRRSVFERSHFCSMSQVSSVNQQSNSVARQKVPGHG